MDKKDSAFAPTQKLAGGTGRRHKEKEPCEGCVYYGGCKKAVRCCNYYLITGNRRPCQQGAGCTVRAEGGRAKRKPMKIRANR